MRPQFILFGDSITESSFGKGGWGASLAHLYSRKADVVLRGYDGYNTRWALFLLPYIFPLDSLKQPSVVTIFFGANDAALVGGSHERHHVPLTELVVPFCFPTVPHIDVNIHRRAAHYWEKCSFSMLIVLVTPPPIDENGRKQHARSLILAHPGLLATYGENAADSPERTNEVSGTYAKSCLEVASEADIPVIDLWSRMQETPGWQHKYLSDGLHLTPDGNAIVFEEILKILNARGLSFSDIPDDFPHHSIIDARDPQKAFHGRE